MSSNSVLALHPFQQAALANVRAQAVSLRLDAVSDLHHIFRMSNVSLEKLDDTRQIIREHARIALHFHPDRPASTGHTVATSLLEGGRYKSQFETGISNGLVATQVGGPRDEWERKLFSGAYHNKMNKGIDPRLRPKYGALDLMRHPDGPAPRFGSCYFILKPEVSLRSTFTFGGSQADPKYRGTIDDFDAVLAALMEECFTRDFALGASNTRPANLVEFIEALRVTPLQKNPTSTPSRNLDHMIEAQIHGDILLGRDIEALVVDPSFFRRRNMVFTVLEAMGKTYGFPLRLHSGFQLHVDGVPADFRGPTMPSLAARVAKDNYVDAEAIGSAVQELTRNPAEWRDRGGLAEVLQELKLLWHVLVRYGQPFCPTLDY